MYKLPYCNPIIDTYSGVAGNVAALMVDEKHISLVIANHFLLTYYELLNAPGFNWAYYNDDFKLVYDMNEELKNKNLMSNIQRALDEGFYVHLYLDHYYIEGASAFGKEHMLHDFATIFGYDSENNTFLVGDNFENGKYCIIEVGDKQIINARKKECELPIEKFKIKDDYHYSMSLSELYKLLERYLEGRIYENTGNINVNNKHLLENGKVIYGINYYNVLYKKIDESKFDPRPFHILINHMEIYDLFNYLFEKSEIIYDKNQYKILIKDIVSEAVILRNMYLKYYCSHTEKMRSKLIDKITQVRDKERELINNILKMLNSFRFH